MIRDRATLIGVRKSLTYFHIQYGGMPMTEAGARRFATMALIGGYSPKEIHEYLFKEDY